MVENLCDLTGSLDSALWSCWHIHPVTLQPSGGLTGVPGAAGRVFYLWNSQAPLSRPHCLRAAISVRGAGIPLLHQCGWPSPAYLLTPRAGPQGFGSDPLYLYEQADFSSWQGE